MPLGVAHQQLAGLHHGGFMPHGGECVGQGPRQLEPVRLPANGVDRPTHRGVIGGIGLGADAAATDVGIKRLRLRAELRQRLLGG